MASLILHLSKLLCCMYTLCSLALHSNSRIFSVHVIYDFDNFNILIAFYRLLLFLHYVLKIRIVNMNIT
jgi:hypothetical protein